MKTVWVILSIVWLIIWVTYFMNNNMKNNSVINDKMNKKVNTQNLEEAYFAGWCFWCMEGIFEVQDGVSEAIAGYLWGDKENANYTEVSTGKTKHREWVKVIYDPEMISFDKLSELFWTQIDPTDDGGQFADRGFQYTTALYYKNDSEKSILEKSKNNLEKSEKFDKSVATKILPFSTFFEAEDYHQDYYKKSEFRYNLYKKWSGRKDFIKNNWEDKIEELEKKGQTQGTAPTKECRGESCIHPEVIWYKDYSEEALKNAKQKYIVLFFHADWCPTCKSFEKKVLSEKIPEDILILKVDFDKELELKRKYNIVTQTSFVLVDSNWNLKKRWIWGRGIDSVTKKIKDFESSNKQASKTYTKEELKARLTPMQYKVTQEGGTEPPFDNEYWNNYEEWIYVDIIDWTPLFSSTDKFDSGTGWPSFTKPIDENFVNEKEDNSLFSKRTEIKSDKSHLWHVFEDGPKDSGWLRYCINSAALKFIPKDELKWTDFEKYLSLFEWK